MADAGEGLKPCPFCGNAEIKIIQRRDRMFSFGLCGPCGAQGPLEEGIRNEASPQERWNRRPTPASEGEAVAVAWRLENLILPEVTFTEDGRFAESLRNNTYGGKPTTQVQPLYAHPVPSVGREELARLKEIAAAVEFAPGDGISFRESGAVQLASDIRHVLAALGSRPQAGETPVLDMKEPG